MPSARPEGAERLRLATWNIEWMNALFDDAGAMLEDAERGGRHEVTRGAQLAAIGVVMAAMEADGLVIVEAPATSARRSTVRALEGFAATCGLRTRAAVIGFASDTEQEIAFLYDPDRLSVRHDPKGSPTGKRGAGGAPRFDGVFRDAQEGDAVPDPVRWARAPLELDLRVAGGGAFRLIGVHAKSKAPYGARSPEAAVRIGIENRRKQLAQCRWLRARAEAHLAAGEALVVAGDFNDGPGLDEYEALFGHSGVEIMLGLGVPPGMRLYDPHAAMALTSRLAMPATTARFFDRARGQYFEALLDFIMVSPGLAACRPDWRIWHPFNDPRIAAMPDLREALLAASDHFPVTLDLPAGAGM